jgi:exonuclease SbcD
MPRSSISDRGDAMGEFRILHISDWHLGKPLGRVDRRRDHDEAIAATLRVATECEPDLVLHTGDVFDTWRPALEDLRRAVRALRTLAEVAPVLVLAGNHDSEDLFRWLDELLGGERIRFLDKPRAPDDDGILDYEIAGGGKVRIASIPFVHANRSLDAAFDSPTERLTAYAERLRTVQQRLGEELLARTDPSRDVAIVACHLHITGAQITRSERPLHVTDSYAVHASAMPKVAYIACGHIHKPQKLPGPLEAYYAGSAIPLDFGEEHDEKRLLLVTLEPGRPARVRSIPIRAGRPLRRLEGTLEDVAALADGVGDAICRVIVHTEERIPGLMELVEAMLPDAELLEVTERSAQGATTLTDPGTESEAEPLEKLFADFAATTPAGPAPLTMVIETFEEILASCRSGRPVSFPELDEAEPDLDVVRPVAG